LAKSFHQRWSHKSIKNLKKIFKLALTTYLIFFIAGKITLAESLPIIKNIKPVIILFIFLVQLLKLGLIGFLQNKIISFRNHTPTKPIEWFSLCVISSFLNLFIPFRGGAIFRLIYLKKNYKISNVNFAKSIVDQLKISLFISFALALLFTIISPKLSLSFKALASTILIIVILVFHYNRRLLKFFTILNMETNLVVLLITLLNSLEIYLGVGYILTDVTYFDCLLISPMLLISSVLSLTPGNLGIREVIIEQGFYALNLQLEGVLTIAVILRAIQSIQLLLLAPICFHLLSKYKPKAPTKE